MKTIQYILTLSIAVLVLSAFTMKDEIKELEIGAKAPLTDVKMKDISGKSVSLQDVAGDNGLLVIFSCNTCPWVLKWEDRYPGIATYAKENGIGTVAINSNEAQRETVDSMEEMKKHAEKNGYNFYYTVDENHKLADAFGATRTPHIYLFNSEMTLVYRGAIDDNASDASKVENHYLKDAIKALAEGKEITKKTSKALGCTIKRISNS
jgi:glutathione peroxidase-family protein